MFISKNQIEAYQQTTNHCEPPELERIKIKGYSFSIFALDFERFVFFRKGVECSQLGRILGRFLSLSYRICSRSGLAPWCKSSTFQRDIPLLLDLES